MSDREPASSPALLPDWEAFYANYRKPGYVPGFELTHKLGGGAFGLVYRAQKQSIGKDYAIKFLKVEDGEVRAAVLSELDQVRYFAQIDHPNLVAIEDRGEVDGIPYLVMGYAGAGTLADRLPAKDAADRRELLGLFLQACRGVSALHERSLVHFDLKPGNVFLKGSVARVGDYGLSRLLTHSRASLTMGRGTPYYMAPELLQRQGDWRSDIYSLGVMLFEILCGQVPFTGESEWEVLKKHEKEAPRYPAELDPQHRRVLERCLQKDPAQRFQSVADLMTALGAPVSTAAAAYDDLRSGTQAPGAPPPASPPPATRPTPAMGPPPVTPPPLPGDSAFQQLQHAAKHAVRSAKLAAQEAVAHARVIARQATDQARTFRLRHLHRRAARDAAGARRLAKQAARKAARAERRRSGGIAAALVTLGLISLVPLAMLSGSAGSREEPATVTIAVGPDTAIWQRDAAAVRAQLPPLFAAVVHDTPPDWLQHPDAPTARGELQRHLAQFAVQAPLTAAQLDHWHGALPAFESVVALGPEDPDRVLGLIGRLAAADQPDPEVAAELTDLGRPALALIAMQLQAQPMLDADGVSRAARLDRFLRQATGFTGINLDRVRPPQQALRPNQAVGALWRWFLFEFARTDAAWRVYCDLRAR